MPRWDLALAYDCMPHGEMSYELPLEPVIRMSHENISVEEFYCKFAPVVWTLFWFWNCLTGCSKHIGWHSTWALWDKQKYVNINSLIGANLQFLKNNRNVLMTHSYNWIVGKDSEGKKWWIISTEGWGRFKLRLKHQSQNYFYIRYIWGMKWL